MIFQKSSYSSEIFVDVDRLILKFIWKSDGLAVTKPISGNKNKAGGITLPDAKAYCTATVNKTMWQRYRHMK